LNVYVPKVRFNVLDCISFKQKSTSQSVTLER
jgi:hypothetical protein